jgi:hypothetical protein
MLKERTETIRTEEVESVAECVKSGEFRVKRITM